jgi:hypothetical protein
MMDLFAARHIVHHASRYPVNDVCVAIYAIDMSTQATAEDWIAATEAEKQIRPYRTQPGVH